MSPSGNSIGERDRLAALHDLKVWPGYFVALMSGEKTFELRKNDRDFRKGDELRLREWMPGPMEYTGRELRRTVSYVLRAEDCPVAPLPAGYAVLGLADAGVTLKEPGAPNLRELMREAADAETRRHVAGADHRRPMDFIADYIAERVVQPGAPITTEGDPLARAVQIIEAAAAVERETESDLRVSAVRARGSRRRLLLEDATRFAGLATFAEDIAKKVAALASAPLPDTEGEKLREAVGLLNEAAARFAAAEIHTSIVLRIHQFLAVPLGERNTPQTEGDPLHDTDEFAALLAEYADAERESALAGYADEEDAMHAADDDAELLAERLCGWYEHAALGEIGSETGPAPQPPSLKEIRTQALPYFWDQFKMRGDGTYDDALWATLLKFGPAMAARCTPPRDPDLRRSEVGARPSPLETEKEGFPDGGA